MKFAEPIWLCDWRDRLRPAPVAVSRFEGPPRRTAAFCVRTSFDQLTASVSAVGGFSSADFCSRRSPVFSSRWPGRRPVFDGKKSNAWESTFFLPWIPPAAC